MFNKDLIKSFNSIFSDYESFSNFCNIFYNDVDLIIKEINKMIKFCLVVKISKNKDFLSIYNNYNKEKLEDEYINYINKQFRFNVFKRKKISSNIIDSSIRVEDLEYFNIPSRERIEDICKYNNSNIKYERNNKEEKDKFYSVKRGFIETAFTYMRAENIKLDKSFIYYHSDLSGNVEKDFNFLYSDGRYSDSVFNPLKNKFENNLDEIKKINDITLRKYGDVYHIINGRHRILYLLNSNNDVIIPVSNVINRIEDEEFNIILKKLIDKYRVVVTKNNLLNDEINVLLEFDGYLYKIRGKDELIEFYNNLESGVIDNCFSRLVCDKGKVNNVNQNVKLCYKNIYNKYLEYGDEFLKGNFTDIVSFFEMDNYHCLVKAYGLIQYDYKKAFVFGYDFNRYYEIVEGIDNMNGESYENKKLMK